MLKEAADFATKKKWIARSPLLPKGRAVEALSDALGLARSLQHEHFNTMHPHSL